MCSTACNTALALDRLGCAKAFHELGAEVALTYLNEKAKPYVEPLARSIDNYNLIRPVKAALEASCRDLAFEPEPRGIRAHPISPGPLKTRAASGLKDFDLLLAQAAQKAPIGELVDIMDVGFACAYLATPCARRVTAGTIYVDGGVHVVA